MTVPAASSSRAGRRPMIVDTAGEHVGWTILAPCIAQSNEMISVTICASVGIVCVWCSSRSSTLPKHMIFFT